MKKIFFAFAFMITSLGIYAQEPMGGGGFGGGRPPMGNFDQMDEDNATEVVKFPEISNLTDKQREKVISLVIKEHDQIAKLESKKTTIFAKYMKNDQSKKGNQQGAPKGMPPMHAGNDSIHGSHGQMPPQGQGMPPMSRDSINGQMPPKDSLRGNHPMPPRGQGQQGGPQMMQGQHPGGPQMMPKLSEKDQKKVAKIQQNEDKIHAKTDKKISSILTAEQYAIFKDKKSEIKFGTSTDNDQDGQDDNRPQGMNGAGGPPDMGGGGGGW